jgi:hypothetical protein
MLAQKKTPKQTPASGRDHGFQQPLFFKIHFINKKKTRPWAYHIILKVKT